MKDTQYLLSEIITEKVFFESLPPYTILYLLCLQAEEMSYGNGVLSKEAV